MILLLFYGQRTVLVSHSLRFFVVVKMCACEHLEAVGVEANAKFEATNQERIAFFLLVLIVAHKYIMQTVKRQFKVTGLGWITMAFFFFSFLRVIVPIFFPLLGHGLLCVYL